MALQTVRVFESGASYLEYTYDDTTFNSQKESYKIVSAKAHNGTDPPRDVTFWVTRKGVRFSQVVAPGQDFNYNPPGNIQSGDITEVGMA